MKFNGVEIDEIVKFGLQNLKSQINSDYNEDMVHRINCE